jgi:queuine tRNA-ribosyltransferase
VIQYTVTKQAAGGGRTGRLRTAHGEVETPAFMPVGTYGTVRGLTPAQLREAGVAILLCNAYHLALRPGVETINKLGGLHRFMGWSGPILTDSGGYQLFSLAAHVKVDERGAVFRSQLDGSEYELTPERAVEAQRALGVDIGMVFDVLIGEPGNREAAASASARTLRWAERTRRVTDENSDTSFFAIMQGGLFDDLRAENARALVGMDFPGYAVGGLSVGEGRAETMNTARLAVDLLPAGKPRYMMGMGTPQDLVDLCAWGYDLFDCVLPTRNGRNGTLFTCDGELAIRNAIHALDDRPVEDGCDCYACAQFSRAYLHHLAKRSEMLGATLASLHNVRFYQRLMADIRAALASDDYERFAREFAARYGRETA